MTVRVEVSGSQRITYTQTWDVDNRLIAVVSGTQATQFYRDADGTLVKKADSLGSTAYVGADDEIKWLVNTQIITVPSSYTHTLYLPFVAMNTLAATTGVSTTYFRFNGQRVTMRQGNTLYWLHGDQLGSASLTTNITGTKVSELRYTPFGETRWVSGAVPTDRLFTGQRSNTLINLISVGAREYSPLLGRFISADSLVPDYSNPQALNKYSYVYNSPLSYVDSDGHVPYPITIRSFAPFDSFGFGFHGDNRSYSVSEESTSRVRQDIAFDTDKQTVSAIARSDPSWLVSDPSSIKTEHPQSEVKSQLAIAAQGNTRTYAFETWYGGSNPFVSPPLPASLTQIDVYASFGIVENRKAGYLDISANLTGDNFPATEAYITDPNGKSVFIGIGFHEGTNKDLAPFEFLPGSNQRQISSMNLRIILDKQGNFASVVYRNWMMTIDQWNGRFTASDPEDKYSFYGRQQ